MFVAFFVFNVEYSPQLHLFYQLFEHVLSVCEKKKTTVLFIPSTGNAFITRYAYHIPMCPH